MDQQSANNSKTLLPQGFHDILPPKANVERHVNKTLLDNFELFGYTLVRPAMLEFEDETSGSASSFRVTDPISGKMLAIRTDITPQISRIAADRLEFQSGKSIRLSYTGQVVRKQGRGRHTERQLTQTGIELLGPNSIDQDSEILFIALDSLKKLSITDYTVDFCIPSVINEMLKDSPEAEKGKIISLIEKKDFAALKNYNPLIISILDICALSSVENYTETLDKILALSIPESCRLHVSNLKALITTLIENGLKFNLSIDLLETMGFEYHSGICFSIFSNKTLEEICRGGRYHITKSSTTINATGFTFLVNGLCRINEFTSKTDCQKISYREGFAKSSALREQGIITIFE